MLRKSWARATKNLGIEVVSKPGLAASDHGGTRCQLTSRVWRLGTELRRSPDFFSQGRILPSMYIYIYIIYIYIFIFIFIIYIYMYNIYIYILYLYNVYIFIYIYTCMYIPSGKLK